MRDTDLLFLKKLLIREVVPATGCTEVGAVALASGCAMQALADPVEKIEEIFLEVDERTYKNALGVGIPGTGEVGLEFAAAMGVASSRNVDRGLQILENPTKDAIGKARALIQEKKIHLARTPYVKEILVLAKIRSHANEACAVIRGSHDHVVSVERNGKPCHAISFQEEEMGEIYERVKGMDYRTLIEFVKMMNVAEYPILQQAMDMNIHFAEKAMEDLSNLEMGKVMDKHEESRPDEKRLPSRIQHITAIAVEARMRGLDFPVMACAGSGNQGLVATIPVVETAKAMKASREHLLRALGLSCLTTIYIKSYTGLLSPVCGCGLAAAVGAGCGIVYLLGGDTEQIEAQINNMVGTMAGMICDGAKSGCSLKALMAVGLAVDSAYLSLENVRIPETEGIMGKGVPETLKNLQRIIEAGMPTMDSVIVELMEAKSQKD
jgi:L-cysteine desulfidase